MTCAFACVWVAGLAGVFEQRAMALLLLAMLTKLRGLHEWMKSLTSDAVPAEKVTDAPWTLDRRLGSCIYFRLSQAGFQAVCSRVMLLVQQLHVRHVRSD